VFLRFIFESLGVFLAKAVIDQQTLGLKLNIALIAVLVGKPCVKELLAESFPSYCSGIDWVSCNDVDGSLCYHYNTFSMHGSLCDDICWFVTEAELTFSATLDMFDVMETVALIPNGENISVTEENKAEYISVLTEWVLRSR
jgi:hypothetical protein